MQPIDDMTELAWALSELPVRATDLSAFRVALLDILLRAHEGETLSFPGEEEEDWQTLGASPTSSTDAYVLIAWLHQYDGVSVYAVPAPDDEAVWQAFERAHGRWLDPTLPVLHAAAAISIKARLVTDLRRSGIEVLVGELQIDCELEAIRGAWADTVIGEPKGLRKNFVGVVAVREGE